MEVPLEMFDFKEIGAGDSILIVHPDRDRATVLINRILRLHTFSHGNILSSSVEHDRTKFRFKKQLATFTTKVFSAITKELYGRQGLSFTVLGAEAKSFRLHFLPRSLVQQSPLMRNLDDESFEQINKFLLIPPSFLVLHYCFPKTFRPKDEITAMLQSPDSRLLFVMSCSGSMKYSPSSVKPKWVFFFLKDFSQSSNEKDIVSWFDSVFKRFFWNYPTFKLFLEQLAPTQGLVVNTRYIGETTEQKPVLTEAIRIVKQLRKKQKRNPLNANRSLE